MDGESFAGSVQKKNEADKELMMTLADGDIIQYNEIKRISVQDFIMKYDSFIKDIEARK